jgi:P-type Cu+ transporter
MSAADPRDRAADQEHDAPERVRDPVCGMSVDPTATPHRAEHAGQHYFFCGAKCRERFIAEPSRYLS